MEPSEAAREGACDSYPFPEPTRPPASGEELFQSSGHAVRRGWLVGQWDSIPDYMKDDFDNRSRLAMEQYEADLDRWRREHTKRYYQKKVGGEALSRVVTGVVSAFVESTAVLDFLALAATSKTCAALVKEPAAKAAFKVQLPALSLGAVARRVDGAAQPLRELISIASSGQMRPPEKKALDLECVAEIILADGQRFVQVGKLTDFYCFSSDSNREDLNYDGWGRTESVPNVRFWSGHHVLVDMPLEKCDNIVWPDADESPLGRVRLTAAREDGACLVLYDGILEFWREIEAVGNEDDPYATELFLTGDVVREEPANTFYIATNDCSEALGGTSHRLASSVTLSRDSAHGQENYHLRMLLKSWSQGTVDRFEEIGGPLYRFNQDENPLPFDLWIEGQNCSSGSFDDLSELWEFLVYVGAWH